MANLPDIFISWQSAAVALVIYAVTESVRRAVQAVWKKWKSNALYTEFVLFALPITVGVMLAVLIPSFAWPSALTSTSSRAMYSAVLGLFAGSVYGWAKRQVSGALSNKPKNEA